MRFLRAMGEHILAVQKLGAGVPAKRGRVTVEKYRPTKLDDALARIAEECSEVIKIVCKAHRTQQNYSTFPQSLMVTLAEVFPLREPTASIFLTTS